MAILLLASVFPFGVIVPCVDAVRDGDWGSTQGLDGAVASVFPAPWDPNVDEKEVQCGIMPVPQYKCCPDGKTIKDDGVRCGGPACEGFDNGGANNIGSRPGFDEKEFVKLEGKENPVFKAMFDCMCHNVELEKEQLDEVMKMKYKFRDLDRVNPFESNTIKQIQEFAQVVIKGFNAKVNQYLNYLHNSWDVDETRSAELREEVSKQNLEDAVREKLVHAKLSEFHGDEIMAEFASKLAFKFIPRDNIQFQRYNPDDLANKIEDREKEVNHKKQQQNDADRLKAKLQQGIEITGDDVELAQTLVAAFHNQEDLPQWMAGKLLEVDPDLANLLSKQMERQARIDKMVKALHDAEKGISMPDEELKKLGDEINADLSDERIPNEDQFSEGDDSDGRKPNEGEREKSLEEKKFEELKVAIEKLRKAEEDDRKNNLRQAILAQANAATGDDNVRLIMVEDGSLSEDELVNKATETHNALIAQAKAEGLDDILRELEGLRIQQIGFAKHANFIKEASNVAPDEKVWESPPTDMDLTIIKEQIVKLENTIGDADMGHDPSGKMRNDRELELNRAKERLNRLQVEVDNLKRQAEEKAAAKAAEQAAELARIYKNLLDKLVNGECLEETDLKEYTNQNGDDQDLIDRCKSWLKAKAEANTRITAKLKAKKVTEQDKEDCKKYCLNCEQAVETAIAAAKTQNDQTKVVQEAGTDEELTQKINEMRDSREPPTKDTMTLYETRLDLLSKISRGTVQQEDLTDATNLLNQNDLDTAQEVLLYVTELLSGRKAPPRPTSTPAVQKLFEFTYKIEQGDIDVIDIERMKAAQINPAIISLAETKLMAALRSPSGRNKNQDMCTDPETIRKLQEWHSDNIDLEKACETWLCNMLRSTENFDYSQIQILLDNVELGEDTVLLTLKKCAPNCDKIMALAKEARFKFVEQSDLNTECQDKKMRNDAKKRYAKFEKCTKCTPANKYRNEPVGLRDESGEGAYDFQECFDYFSPQEDAEGSYVHDFKMLSSRNQLDAPTMLFQICQAHILCKDYCDPAYSGCNIASRQCEDALRLCSGVETIKNTYPPIQLFNDPNTSRNLQLVAGSGVVPWQINTRVMYHWYYMPKSCRVMQHRDQLNWKDHKYGIRSDYKRWPTGGVSGIYLPSDTDGLWDESVPGQAKIDVFAWKEAMAEFMDQDWPEGWKDKLEERIAFYKDIWEKRMNER